VGLPVVAVQGLQELDLLSLTNSKAPL